MRFYKQNANVSTVSVMSKFFFDLEVNFMDYIFII